MHVHLVKGCSPAMLSDLKHPVLLQLLSVCREDGVRLTKLRHPQILRLLEPFEETRRQGQQRSAWPLGDGGW